MAKRLVVKSTDDGAMSKSLRQHGLTPTANIVVKLPGVIETNSTVNSASTASSRLTDRAASKKKLKKGSHTMQSIGVYSTEDNAKGELIDGGGGTWYEHDVDDDEEEPKVEPSAGIEEPNELDGEHQVDKVSDSEYDEEESAEKR